MEPFKIKFKEVVSSVAPITIIVIILNFTLTPMGNLILMRFLTGAFVLIVGMTLFLVGVDISLSPIGNEMGAAITLKNKIWIVVVSGLVLGFLISIAEPDLHILANQVDMVSQGVVPKAGVIVIVSIGIALAMVLGLLRILYNIPLYIIFTVIYFLILVLGKFTNPIFLAISFDASGATTGAVTVPFMLALSMGIANLKQSGKDSEKDSFGLVGIVSSGAIIAVMAMSIVRGAKDVTGDLHIDLNPEGSILAPFLNIFPSVALEILAALGPIVVIFLIFQPKVFKLYYKTLRKIMFGVVFTYLGLVLFLTGVHSGFMEVGSQVGYLLASKDTSIYLIVISFALGAVTVLAEPAVSVLTHQVEEVTKGYVQRKIVLVSLTIGVGLAVTLSIIRILIPAIKLWQYLLPGYILAIALMYISPKLFTGIAFDAGGVASGPMTATFILAFAQGAAQAIPGADVLIDGFGLIAMVALAPLIALQILGVVFKIKSKKRGVSDHE